MIDVFISYSRKERPKIQRLAIALEARGHKVWWDHHIEGGTNYAAQIARYLQQSRVVVVAWSKYSVESEWVLDEADEARNQGKLLPIALDDTKPPLGFRQRQSIDFSAWDGSGDSDEVVQLDATIDKMASGLLEDIGLVGQSAEGNARRGLASPRRRSVLVGGGAVLLAAGGASIWGYRALNGPGSEKRIAIIPFDVDTGNSELGHLADDFAAAIRNRLSLNPLLHIAARISSSAVSTTDQTASAICRVLGVDYLLNGSIRFIEKRLRVAGELIEGASERLMLPIQIEAPIDNLFDVQLQIASDVVSRLTNRSDAGSTEILGGTRNLAAYDAFLRGRELYEAGINEDSDRAALAKFEEAIQLDPQFAAAHAKRGRTLALIGNLYAGPEDRDITFGYAAQAAQRAIEIAPEFADGHAVLGFVKASGQLDMRAARAPHDKAIQLGNGDADIVSRYAIFRSRIGDQQGARRAIERAKALDPLNSRVFRFAGTIAYQSRQYSKAIIEFERARDLQPGLSSYHYLVGLAQLAQGRLSDAKASFDNEKFFVWKKTGLAIVEEKLGNKAVAENHLAELQSRQGNKSNYQYLQVNAQWGNLQAALDAMDAAWAAFDSGLVQLYTDPLLDDLRDSARFQKLMAQIGFS